jgi:lantibiotic modifying enzyme
MECIEARACQSTAAVRRFYQRLGATIAAVYLIKGVDCHRENIIAAGEFPILVDIDALWHVSALTKTQTRIEVLYRTGFFPSSRPDSLQSRSSVLGPGPIGTHRAPLRGKIVSPSNYEVEILQGFSNAWTCLVGTSRRRTAFRRRVRRVQMQERRWIYCATEKYGAILQASIRPGALGSAGARARIIRRLCSRDSVSKEVVNAEVNALRRLDLPYFVRKTAESVPADPGTIPTELLQAIRNALLHAETRVGDER